jgi:predicted membrane-bound dolichyl-phosphate-mannose-protein mannosyltransferase
MLAIGGAMLLYVVVVFLLDRQCGQALSWDPNTLNGAVAGGVTSAVSVLASFFAIQPWKSRPAGDWMLYWLGSTTARFLITPPALFSVYSATLLPAAAVFLGGATMFIVALLLETAVIARAVLQAASSSSGSGTS